MRGLGFVSKQFRNARILAFGYDPERVSISTWEQQFSSGAWKRLESIPEMGHYSITIGLCALLSKKKILDVCCGQGILAERLKYLPYEKYIGIDISASAVREASMLRADARNQYLVADAKVFSSNEMFDMVIFHECLYYLDDPIGIIRHYIRYLEPNGHILVSMYDSIRSRAVWKLLNMELMVDDGVQITHISGASWTVKTLVPISKQAGPKVSTQRSFKASAA